MQLDEIQTLIGSLTNDPNHDRYSLTDINTELDNTMDDWNIKARIVKDTATLTVVDGTRQYALSTLIGTPIGFPRVTHKGLELEKKSKSWLDLYSGTDWTTTIGTPKYFIIEATDPNAQYLTIYPTPQSADAGPYLVAEYVVRHTPMGASTDTPFMQGTSVNYLLRPYDWGLCYSVSAKLLIRDPDPLNRAKVDPYAKIGNGVLADVIQTFKSLEREEPRRFSGGRYWQSGDITIAK